ncbi:MAG: 4-(cytidine 5'-diphospho)-2-C-methyl-D-erythritol kinase [Tannerella sp.]|jgi:4-diphosphocytidyl-2-C-methyl-D-erythritol kinase|nr:4-(cytidine 5'-diphospho)-2-C-methyl-D-erythritol kinase [Tannerella sp.]
MICFPNAKINLGLHVIRKRSDRYHDIETIFYPVPLKDALEVVPASGFSFRQVGTPVEGDPQNNLVIKALKVLQRDYEIPPVEIYLKKAIPCGAGLGGGSSDASFMLKLLNAFAGLNLPEQTLERLAASLGADCPFFIRNTPVLASGTGTVFEEIPLSLKGSVIYIIKPDAAVSTQAAYASVTPAKPSVSLKEIAQTPVNEWKDILVNDFERSVFKQYPVIQALKNKLYEQGAVYASMSGSGSAVFGLFEQDVTLNLDDCFSWKGILE